ncbi:MAG: preprotein translocase subunit SecG [Gammaproteobacteria bacterium]|nr:preprotein translocase subunit SecG [Gammaproteobacteria bacterium]
MQTILVVFHLFLALGLIGLVLMQHGKGADAGAAFGSGASGTVFGASGAANFLSRATALLATLFFVTSLVLAWYAMQATDRKGLMEEQQAAPASVTVTQPATEIPDIPGTGRAADSGAGSVPNIPASANQDGVPKPAE